jgi:DMSO reductase family type II enzyme molybdopterin subunit
MSEDRYRKLWSWDETYFGTHCLNCMGTCPYRVFVKDGRVVFEEPAGNIETTSPRLPDLNPMGCQKGSAWSRQLYSPDRITKPLKRAGERGSGAWQEVTWEEALVEIADAILDAIEEEGPESIVFEETVEGGLAAWAAYLRFASLIGAVTLDANGLINDLPIGQYITFGKFACASTVDDTFDSELILIWHSNPAYTWIPYFHYIPEARYNGATVVTIAPDYSPSAPFSDVYIPIAPGTDAALLLAACKVVCDEGMVDEEMALSQTDLPLLVRLDTMRFLAGPEVRTDARPDQFFWALETGEIEPAPRGTLELPSPRPVLDFRGQARLADGSAVEVASVYNLLQEHLRDYDLARASRMCGVHPSIIEWLARQVASHRTKVLEGFNGAKYYHGDLMERSMCLLLGLTGNWGKPGTGIQGLALAGMDGYLIFPMKQRGGLAETDKVLDGLEKAIQNLGEQDPEASPEMVGLEMLARSVAAGTASPPVFFHYYHCGYDENWNNAEWSDPSMKKSFGQYLDEAIRRGWWGGLVRPDDVTEPKIFFAVGTNPLRRARGGRRRFLEHLWPKLDLVVTVDNRMSTTALHSDFVLPAAMQYERPNLQYAITHTFRLCFSDRAVEPQGEAKTEWEIFKELAEAVERQAKRRGMLEFQDGRRRVRRLDNLAQQFTYSGSFSEDEQIVDEWIRDSALAGTLPPGTSIDTLRQKGSCRFVGLGKFAPGLAVAAEVLPDAPLVAYSEHVTRKVPYPTLTRRAQFYIDHAWFIEGGEALPVHKDPPAQGGNYPLMLTSGHSRWTVHSVSMGNQIVLETHRGQPTLVINPVDLPRELDAKDMAEVEVYNDHGSFVASLRISSRVRPGQVILYNGFEPHMFPSWEGANEVEPGMVKWLHLVGKYGHLRYLPFGWQPVPSDRAVRVAIRPYVPSAS